MKEKLISIITDENKRKKLQFITVNLFFAGVSAVMTILNIMTGKGSLTAATAIFSVLCLINYYLVVKGGRIGMEVVNGIFMIEIIMLDTFFLVSGNPDGFSVIWVAMLPYCSMLLFGRKRAAVFSACMLAIIVFFLWVPAGREMLRYNYNKTFMMRFPILYTAFFLLSILMETIREITQKELERLRETYHSLYTHDYLTHLLNRAGLRERRLEAGAKDDQAVFMLDIDHFKAVNDSYGHEAGDKVLEKVAEKINSISGVDACRWGGEEFIIWFPDRKLMCDPDSIRREVEQMEIELPGGTASIHVTVSIGVAEGGNDFEKLVQYADKCMYQAKESGRNRVVRGSNT